MNLLIKTTVSVLLFALWSAQSAKAETSALFGVFQSDSDQNYQKTISRLENLVKKQGCTLRREGKIMGSQGNYKLPPVNQFFLLKCNMNVLANKLASSWIEQLQSTTKNLVILEGAFLNLEQSSITGSGTSRSYIFKLSDYNNIDPSQRTEDLIELGEMVETREHKYTTEAFVRVNNAFGMNRPDELVVIHYDSKEDGEKFRLNNADILSNIGEFNQAHLTQFSYLFAQSNR
ncbi:MAG: hypothetical protein KUG78_19040 [Kangiellaceae bacterium]|nr:hypothetical protein [Kangiellaceae bacterium]